MVAQRAVVLEDVKAALPTHVQDFRSPPDAHEDVTGRKLGARRLDFGTLGTQHVIDALGFLGTAQHASITREVFYAAVAPADAQHVRGQVDTRDILADEFFEVRIGDVHGRS